jgi:hypothetical protein
MYNILAYGTYPAYQEARPAPPNPSTTQKHFIKNSSNNMHSTKLKYALCKHVCVFHIQNCLKQGNALSPLFLNCYLKQGSQTHSPLVNFSGSFHITILLGLLEPEDESTVILQNVGTHPPTRCHISQDLKLRQQYSIMKSKSNETMVSIKGLLNISATISFLRTLLYGFIIT